MVGSSQPDERANRRGGQQARRPIDGDGGCGAGQCERERERYIVG